MKKILLYVKKILAIIISLIFGIFQDENNENKIKTNDKLKKDIKEKKIKNKTVIYNEEELGSKSRKSNNNQKDENILYYAKKDIQKLLFIQKEIEKLEQKISTCNDLTDLYELKKEINKLKFITEKITCNYEKNNENEKIIKDIKEMSLTCKNIIKKSEKELDKKIYKLENKNENEIDKIEDDSKEKVEEPKAIQDEIKKEPLEEKQKEVKEPIEILEIITLKEPIEKEFKIEISKGNNKEQKDSSEKKVVKKDKLSKKDLKTKEEKSKEINRLELVSRKETINKKNIKKNVDKLKLKNKLKIIALTAVILSKILSVVKQVSLAQVLKISPQNAVLSALNTNNEIRRIRSLNKKKVKKLKLEQVQRKVGNNKELQLKAIMSNSISEIRKLKSELSKYEFTDDLAKILNELNELELEVILQLQELEQEKSISNRRTR